MNKNNILLIVLLLLVTIIGVVIEFISVLGLDLTNLVEIYSR